MTGTSPDLKSAYLAQVAEVERLRGLITRLVQNRESEPTTERAEAVWRVWATHNAQAWDEAQKIATEPLPAEPVQEPQ